MKKLTLRHLGGGFLGGVLGLLTCGLVSRWLMPLGCLIGVIIGFYLDLIVLEFRKGWLAGASWYKALHHPSLPITHAIFRRALHHMTMATQLVASACSSLYKKYEEWRRSFNQHPMNMARLIARCSTIALSSAIIFGIIRVTISIIRTIGEDSPLSPYPQIMTIALAVVVSVIPVSSILASDRYHEKPDHKVAGKFMCRFYRAYEIASKKHVGIPLFFCWDLWRLLRLELILIPTFTLWMLYIPMSVILVMPLACLAWAMTKLLSYFYHLTLRQDHWLCLAVVLIVTPITALTLRHHLSGQILWLSALGNGTLCALLSEEARQLSAKAFERLDGLRNLATSSIDLRMQYKALIARREPILYAILKIAHGF